MANRSIKIPGIWANGGTTTIPPTPVPNTTYRDATLDSADSDAGFPYAKIVDSATFNQYMWLLSTLITQAEAQGLLSWSPTQQYLVANGAAVIGSDGNLYIAIADSLNNDPTANPTKWQLLGAIASNAEAITGTDAVKSITPASLVAAHVCGSTAAGWYEKRPGGTIEQWGAVSIVSASSGTGSDVTITLPLAMPNANYSVQLTMNQPSGGVLSGNFVAYYNSRTTTTFKAGIDQNGATGTFTVSWHVIGRE